MPTVRRNGNTSSMLSLYYLSNAPLGTQGKKTNAMEEVFKMIIKISEELLDPYCTLKDTDLVNKLQELEALMEQVDESGKWDETDFTYHDRWYTEGVIQHGVKCKKRRTIEQFYKQYGTIPFQDFLRFLKKCIESYLKKNYNIS